jgi:hypothetical protein
LIFKPAMDSCIKVVKQKKLDFLLKKKVSKRTQNVPFSVIIDAFAKLCYGYSPQKVLSHSRQVAEAPFEFPTEKKCFQEDHILGTKGVIFSQNVPYSVIIDAFAKL